MSSTDQLQITPLGSGREVGRSCHIIKFKGKCIMLDMGVHPANSGLDALPFIDSIDPSEIDLCLVSHFHLDHSAALAYLLTKTSFNGRVFMTHPTKAIYSWLLSDFIKVSNDQLYTEDDLQDSYDQIETMDFHQTIDVEGIRITAYYAGHVLGAAAFMIEIAGVRIFYTGDYSREEDRHLMPAEIPPQKPDVLICEATYGVQTHAPRPEREHRLTSLVHRTVERNGRCLIPIFALGRAQELLLILDEYWSRHPEIQHIPVYYASNLAKKCIAVYQTYINQMNRRIRLQFERKNPFVFRYIQNLKNMEQFEDKGPCVVLASPAMLQNGLSRILLEKWGPDKKNGIIIPGYVIDGTLGHIILSEPKDFPAMNGSRLPLRASVDYISFSAHVDFIQNKEFIEALNPSHVVLVHGEANGMQRLSNALMSSVEVLLENEVAKPGQLQYEVHMPKNVETLSLTFRGELKAKIIGKISNNLQDTISGLLITKDHVNTIISTSELLQFTDLSFSTINHRVYVGWKHTHTTGWSFLKQFLTKVFGIENVIEHSKTVKDEEVQYLILFQVISIVPKDNLSDLVVEWTANPFNDMVADAAMILLIQMETLPFAMSDSTKGGDVKMEEADEVGDVMEIDENAAIDQLKAWESFFNNQFDVQIENNSNLRLNLDGQLADFNPLTREVTGDNEQFKKRIESLISLAEAYM